ncbi:MFS transporter [Fundidesulfovibrio agrisoli]|uniref:MFS transporter n=1 Tax=Fundidesulfovibrio agrisoli TaxID=2922717 RepID=UPI001FAD9512|nr:MFS transporter [Fundidesulfovibrio agrisoli]
MKLSPFRMLCAAGLLAILSSTMSKNPVLPLFAAHLGAGPQGIGLVGAVSPLAGVLISIPGGLLSDAFGRRRMLAASALVFASAPFAYLLVDGVWGLALARFYHGLATGIFLPVAMAAVADAHQSDRGEKMGAFSSATLAGRFVAPLLGGLALGLGFDAVYVLCGLAGVGVFLISWRLPALEEKTPHKERPPLLQSLRETLASRSILAGCALEAGILFAYGIFETFLPLVSLERGNPAWVTGALFSAQVLAVALTKPFFGRLSDRAGRTGQMLTGAALLAACCAAVPWVKGLTGLAVLAVGLGLALSVATAASQAFVADASKREHRGAAMGLLGSIMDIGHSTGPLLGGMAAALAGSAGAFALGGAVLAACAAGVFRATRNPRPAP